MDTFGILKVKCPCRLLSSPIVPILAIYNDAELNGIVFVQYYFPLYLTLFS